MTKLLIFGGAGMVGSRFIDLFKDHYSITAPTIEEFDFLDFPATRQLVETEEPGVIINFAAMTNVEASEAEKDDTEGITYRVNTAASKNLAEVAKDLSTHLIHISTEYVFDGEKESPYTEEDQPNPINWYGQTKYLAEKFIQDSGCDYTILRISMPYSPHFELKKDIVRRFLEMLQNNQEIKAITDSDITPILVDDIAASLDKIIERRALGIYHAVSTDSTTPFNLARLVAKTLGLNEALVKEISFDEYNKDKSAKLLKHSWLDCSKFQKEFGSGILHSVEESVEQFRDLV